MNTEVKTEMTKRTFPNDELGLGLLLAIDATLTLRRAGHQTRLVEGTDASGLPVLVVLAKPVVHEHKQKGRMKRALVACCAVVLISIAAFAADKYVYADGTGWGSDKPTAMKGAVDDASEDLGRKCPTTEQDGEGFYNMEWSSKCDPVINGSQYRCTVTVTAICRQKGTR
jgi:hypothetical protein